MIKVIIHTEIFFQDESELQDYLSLMSKHPGFLSQVPGAIKTLYDKQYIKFQGGGHPLEKDDFTEYRIVR